LCQRAADLQAATVVVARQQATFFSHIHVHRNSLWVSKLQQCACHVLSQRARPSASRPPLSSSPGELSVLLPLCSELGPQNPQDNTTCRASLQVSMTSTCTDLIGHGSVWQGATHHPLRVCQWADHFGSCHHGCHFKTHPLDAFWTLIAAAQQGCCHDCNLKTHPLDTLLTHFLAATTRAPCTASSSARPRPTAPRTVRDR